MKKYHSSADTVKIQYDLNNDLNIVLSTQENDIEVFKYILINDNHLILKKQLEKYD